MKVDRLEDVVRRAKEWKLDVKIDPPQASETPNNAILITGTGDLRTTAAQMESGPAVNLVLEENRVELVPFVRQVSNKTSWAVQSKLLVRQGGYFDGVVFLGDEGYQYQIVVLAVPSGSVEIGQLEELPFSYAASNSVVVKRVRRF